MMEITIKSGFLRKRKFAVRSETLSIVKKLAVEYGLSEEDIIRMAIKNEEVHPSGDPDEIKKLRDEIDKLNKRMFVLEGEWSAIKYKAHTLARDNKTLAVVLTGLLSQNKTLRRQLGLKREYDELRELTDYYLFQVRGSKM